MKECGERVKSGGSEALWECVLFDMSQPCQGLRPWTPGKLAKLFPSIRLRTMAKPSSGLSANVDSVHKYERYERLTSVFKHIRSFLLLDV